MNEEAIKRIVEFVAKQGAAKAALQPASLAPQPATMTAYDPSLREKISGITADMLMNASLAKDNYEAQELGGKLTNLSEFSPLGMVTAADDFSRAGDMPTAALAALGMVPGVGKVDNVIRHLPSSASLNLPSAPSVANMVSSRIEAVPLAQARGTQSKMQFDRFKSGDHPPPLIEGYEDLPVAVRREDGEYLIFDGHHRTVNAINEGQEAMPMYVIDAKDYAPEAAGRKPAIDDIDVDALLSELLK